MLLIAAATARADVDERDIRLTGSGSAGSHGVERKKVKLHKNEGRKGHKQDVVVWQVMNDCEAPERVLICTRPDILDSCASFPRELDAMIRRPFTVQPRQRVSLACRGGRPGTSGITVYTGDDATNCAIEEEHHVIDIEVVP